MEAHKILVSSGAGGAGNRIYRLFLYPFRRLPPVGSRPFPGWDVKIPAANMLKSPIICRVVMHFFN